MCNGPHRDSSKDKCLLLHFNKTIFICILAVLLTIPRTHCYFLITCSVALNIRIIVFCISMFNYVYVNNNTWHGGQFYRHLCVSGGAEEYICLVPDMNRCLKTGFCFPFYS